MTFATDFANDDACNGVPHPGSASVIMRAEMPLRENLVYNIAMPPASQ